MKRLFATVCTLLVGASASATVYDSNFGNAYQRQNEAQNRAQRICYDMTSSKSVSCMSLVTSSRFSLEGVKVCEEVGVFDENQKLNCLRTIANKAYQKELTQTCEDMGIFDGNVTVSCLADVANKRVQVNAVNFCKVVGQFSNPLKMSCINNVVEKSFSAEGLEMCESINFDHQKMFDCAKSIANAYIQPEAANLCMEVGAFNADAKLACAQRVKNKHFSTSMLNFCDSRFSDSQKLECLAAAEATSYRIPEFRADRQRSELDIILDTLDYILNGERTQTQTQPVIVVPSRPQVQTNKCQVKQTGEIVETEQFYRLAQGSARQERKCVVARMANTDNSSSLIDEDGITIGKNLSYKKLADVKRNSKLAGKGCLEYICDDSAR